MLNPDYGSSVKRRTPIARIAALAATAAFLAASLSACMTAVEQNPSSPSSSSPSEVTVSTPPDTSTSPSPTAPPVNADFETAVKFARLVLATDSSKMAETRDLLQPESAAARYVAHQTLVDKAQSLANVEESTREPTVAGNAKTGQIKISYAATDEDKAENYTWKDFTFNQGKITGWTGPNGPIGSNLWSRQTTAESRGRTAVLKSAYRSNSGNLWVVVELSSKVASQFNDAQYAAKDGYRQTSTDWNSLTIEKGEKALAYFAFKDTKFPGQIYIPYTDEDGSSYNNWILRLSIK